MSELLREPHKVSFHRCYMCVWISVCTGTTWTWKKQTLRQDEASLVSFGLSLTLPSHAPHRFHLHPDSSEVPCSNTPHLVCTAWSWCWVGWDLESRGPCRYRPPWQWWGGAGSSEAPRRWCRDQWLRLLAWSEQPGVGADLPRVWGLSLLLLYFLSLVSVA